MKTILTLVISLFMLSFVGISFAQSCEGEACPSGYVCVNNTCVVEGGCTAPCPTGQKCVKGRCKGKIIPAPECGQPDQMACPANQKCVRGKCKGRII